MASGSSSASNSSSMPSVENYLRRKSNDIAWEYGMLVDASNVDKVKCKLCSKVFSGGAYRIKEHVGHIMGNVSSCPKSTKDDQMKCIQAINDAKLKKRKKIMSDDELRAGVNIEASFEELGIEGLPMKMPHFLGPMDKYASPIDPERQSSSEITKRQQSISSTLFKERQHKVHDYLAMWVFEAAIPFHAVCNDSFKKAVEAIGQFGPGLKIPSAYMYREPLLKKQMERMKGLLKTQEEEWKLVGCSLMTDAWTDRKRRSIMNFCVNCKVGTAFLESKECSEDAHTAEFILEHVLKYIEQVGQKNVVQVVTDNAANNMAAARMLKVKMPAIFWSSCATHTINLMLESIGKLPMYKKAIDLAKSFTIFIYAHHRTLALMRTFTKKRDIVRPGVTRFASSFLTLQSLMEKKDKLKAMFVSTAWNECKWAKQTKGKAAYNTVMSNSFWSSVSLCLKVFAPLVKVLRLVDGDRRPSMAFLFGELLAAKKEIKEVMRNIERNYQPILQIIDEKMEGRLDTPLHVAAYYLNPFYFYNDPYLKVDRFLVSMVVECVETMFCDDLLVQDSIVNNELAKYKLREGDFAKALAIKGCEKNDEKYDPVQWWYNYGNRTPNLQKMATRILSLTSSSSGCERNWSTFEGVHTKKRNRLDANRLNNLVFIQFNARMINQHKKRMENDKVDVLISSDAGNAQGWIVSGGDDEESDLDLHDVEVRELDDDVDPSDDEEIYVECESDNELVLEEYGEDDMEDDTSI